MSHPVGLARAAQLLNISRRELQKLIHKGDLNAFEGYVDADDLRRRFPCLVLDNEPALERAALLRQTAYARRVQEVVLPEGEDLADLLRKRTVDLGVERARAAKYCALLRELSARIVTMHGHAEGEAKNCLEELNLWLLQQFEETGR